jgi:hypothetical protein
MPTRGPLPIPFPLSSFPGASAHPGSNNQEGAGRLVNCYAEPLGEATTPTGPSKQVWRRSPGLSQHNNAPTGQSGYRGGLIVNNLSYECWSGNASTLDVAGNYVSLGAFPGTKKVSIARNQAASPNVVAVDPDNGAYVLSGGGAPAFYNGGGNLPQPNSVCFQDGYFFYTIGDNRCFASPLNSVGTINTQTFITAQAKSDVNLLRGIAYGGLLWLFTTGHCEIWQDTAVAAPAFPYTRLLVIEYGLVQQAAIAGWETGFSELLWAAQDFGVYWATPGSFQPIKVSSPDIEKLIEQQVRAGNTLEASVYAFAGKKFWVLSSPAWTWEFNISTKKWNERSSLAGGAYGRWRATGGHPAFNKWLMGDTQTGNLFWLDNSNYTENGAPQLFRIESGPVRDFPNSIRIARADFDFVMGVGTNVANTITTVLGAAANPGGLIRLQVANTAQMSANDTVNVVNVLGTTEANGAWQITVVDPTHIDLQATVFAHAYVSGGQVTDVTAPSGQVAPTVAISCSKDGGYTWGNPLLRQLGQQGKTKRNRVSVKNMGMSSPLGDRWRLDVTDPVYTAILGGTQSSNPAEVGA